ncbi:MAG: aminotransferase class V-fold PLP-dependent enzyme [Ruminococcus sp.]|nr:aminotransferase class V-fold PLP-dependent enzyme [Ruminococcus sp.]
MVYFDNSATSFPKPVSVRRACETALERYGANPGRSGHALSVETAKKVYEVRNLAAGMFGAQPENVAFTPNCTYALNMAIKGMMQYGGHIIISPYEHNSSARPAFRLTQTAGVRLSVFEMGRDDEQTLKNIRSLIRRDTKCVCVTAASNVTGRIMPIREIAALCKSEGICFIVDGAQACGVVPLSLADGMNFICAAGHKGLYGPTGTGLLISDGEYALSTIIEGGTGVTSAQLEQTADMPERLESGTLNTVGILGLGEGIRFVRRKGTEVIRAHEEKLCRQFIEGIKGIRGVRLYEPDVPRAPIVAFNIGERHSEETAKLLGDRGFALRGGLQCAPLAHRAIGTLGQGVVRFSPSAFNSVRQTEALIMAVRAVRI